MDFDPRRGKTCVTEMEIRVSNVPKMLRLYGGTPFWDFGRTFTRFVVEGLMTRGEHVAEAALELVGNVD